MIFGLYQSFSPNKAIYSIKQIFEFNVKIVAIGVPSVLMDYSINVAWNLMRREKAD
jgi:hypothetical protein